MSKTVKFATITVAITALAVGLLGYLTSGFRDDEITLDPTASPVVSPEDALAYEGWQLNYGSFNDDGTVKSYKGARVKFTVDPELVASYEEQGYTVEYGLIYGLGTYESTFYNSPSTLAVTLSDGKLVSKTDQATVALVYSTDENAELAEGHVIEDESSPFVWMKAELDFGGEIYVDGDQSLDNKTYVAAAFIRLTTESGKAITKYVTARELLSVVPVELGSFE